MFSGRGQGIRRLVESFVLFRLWRMFHERQAAVVDPGSDGNRPAGRLEIRAVDNCGQNERCLASKSDSPVQTVIALQTSVHQLISAHSQ